MGAALMWLAALQLAGSAVFGLAGLAEVLLRRRSAAARRGAWALAIGVALALPLTRLALPAPTWSPTPALAGPLLSLWAAGALVLLVRLARAQARAAARARRGRAVAGATRVALRVSDELDAPQVIGALRPVIVVPAALCAAPAAARRAVLAHELAHVIRGDATWRLAGAIARAIYWVSPLSWWALRRLRVHAEHAADDAALGTGVPSSSYAAQLVGVARARLERAGRVAADGLRERVRGILDVRRIRSRAPQWSAPGVVAVAALLATLATACEARSEPPGATVAPSAAR